MQAVGLTDEQIRIVAGMKMGRDTAAKLAGSPAPAPSAKPAEDAPEIEGSLQVEPPPLSAGVSACEAWAAALAAQAFGASLDDETARALRKAVQSIGKLKEKASRSEKAVRLRALREGVRLDLTAEAAPADPIALPAWAFLRCCWATYQITRGDLGAAGPSLDLLAAVGYVPSNGAIRDLTKRLIKPAAQG